MASYDEVHAGDHVLGHDGDLWGVEAIEHGPRLAVTLVKPGHRVTGYPPPGTQVTIVYRSDMSAELVAAQALIDGGLNIEIVSERYQP